jgi:hypothetical protein
MRKKRAISLLPIEINIRKVWNEMLNTLRRPRRGFRGRQRSRTRHVLAPIGAATVRERSQSSGGAFMRLSKPLGRR